GVGLRLRRGFERDFEGVDFLVRTREAYFANLERRVVEDRVVEVANVVVEIPRSGAVGGNRRRGKTEVGVVGEDLFVDLLVVDGDRRDRRRHGDVRVGDVFARKQAALQVVVGSGLHDIVVRAD